MTDNQQQRERGPVPRCLRLGAAGIAVAAVALAPACGDDDAGDAAASTTTADPPETTSTTAQPTPEEEAEAVYLELVDVVYRLLTTEPDPDDPDLARLAMDPALGNFRDSLSTMRAETRSSSEVRRRIRRCCRYQSRTPQLSSFECARRATTRGSTATTEA